MTREWKRRLVATLLLCAVAEALRWIPLPGVDVAALAARWTDGAPSSWWLARMRMSVGALGIGPYVLASLLVVFARSLRRSPPAFAADDYERPTWAVAPVVAMGLGLVMVMPLTMLSAHAWGPGLQFLWFAAMLASFAAATLVQVALAHAVTRAGIGNGVCVLALVEYVRALLLASGLGVPGDAPALDVWLPGAVAGMLVVVLSLRFMQARIELPLAGAGGEAVEDAPTVPLRRSGIGVAAVQCAAATLAVVSLFPLHVQPGEDRGALGVLLEGGPAHAFALLALSVAFTFFLLSQAFDPDRLAGTIARAGFAVDAGSLAGPLRAGLLPGPILLAVVASAWGWFAARSEAAWLPGFVALVVIVALTLSLVERARLHVRLLTVLAPADADAECPGCGGLTRSDAASCARCGSGFLEDARCHAHPDRPATATCVACGQWLCTECDALRAGHHHCAGHAGLELMDGWSVVLRPSSRIEAELACRRLAAANVGSEILENTIAPLVGCLGAFEVAPTAQLLPCSALAGGGYAVLVPAARHDVALALVGPPRLATPCGPL